MAIRSFGAHAECDVCSNYAAVHTARHYLCGVCFAIVSTLLTKRMPPHASDVHELSTVVYDWPGDPTAVEISRLLEIVNSVRADTAPSWDYDDEQREAGRTLLRCSPSR